MRLLTDREITTLKAQGCTAEDWTAISVSEEFTPDYIRAVDFFGEIQLGVFEKSIEVGSGFSKHSGISHATLRNVIIGDNCLIEHIGCYINNYRIGDDCLISNAATVETTEGATFGEGTIISVLNEAGNGNILIYSGLTSQMASMMVKYECDREFTSKLRQLIRAEIEPASAGGVIGNRCRIVNTQNIVNCIISDDCEIDGACRLSDCSLRSLPDAPVYIGSGVICENSIILDGTSILNSAKLENCFVGEACLIKNGFTAENCVFFANGDMANGEACAAFCGPFTTSHHKSTLLISTATSFFNAGSGTNFSNHAYKMGPVHHGTLERGAKTASSTHILLPAQIGLFSVCFGKIYNHPDTRRLPFSYIFGTGNGCTVIPGRNIISAGLFRDIRKWPKRDKRTAAGRCSIVNFDPLPPLAISRIIAAKRTLEDLQRSAAEQLPAYEFQNCVIKASSLRKGIEYYDLALKIFFGKAIENLDLTPLEGSIGDGEWSDLGGMLLPLREELRIVDEVKNETITSASEILERFKTIHANYAEYRRAWSLRLLCEYFGVSEITEELAVKIREDYLEARRTWINEIRRDALREFDLGDVPDDTLSAFLSTLDQALPGDAKQDI
ncbi:MAG: DUF4954 family protein [Prevotella sp.]|nr:DUF4954 family protein [Prevotella sp.]